MMMKMKSVAAAAVTTVLLLLVVEECSAFSVIPKASVTAGRRSRLAVALTAVKGNNSDNLNSDFPPEEETAEYTGSVDWDAEWKKVVKNGGVANSGDRPGKEFYKSEAEIAAIVSFHERREAG